jgi:hypothetical protein
MKETEKEKPEGRSLDDRMERRKSHHTREEHDCLILSAHEQE